MAGVKKLKDIRIGDFAYVNEAAGVGQNRGNHFIITLRNIRENNPEADAEELQRRLEGTLHSLRDVGYLNYYGLQRFGNEGKTVEIGCLMLRNEWEAAVMAILRSNRSGGMVEALRVYEETKDGLEALKVSVERGGDAQKLPRYMSTEIALFRALGKSGGKGFSVGVWRASEA